MKFETLKKRGLSLVSKYGIGTVVGGFGREMTPEESIPYTLARTYHEHQMLRKILSMHVGTRGSALDIGCGFGRNLPVLQEFSSNVMGIERDNELREIAKKLNPDAWIFSWDLLFDRKNTIITEKFKIVMTFTVLQHMRGEEFEMTVANISRIVHPEGILLLVEETDPAITDDSTMGRSVASYGVHFGSFDLIASYPRVIETTFPKADSGHFMVFKKRKA